MEYVHIAQAEEMPVLSEAEEAELLQSFKDAEARLAAGQGVTFKQGEFGVWMRERMKELRGRRKRAV